MKTTIILLAWCILLPLSWGQGQGGVAIDPVGFVGIRTTGLGDLDNDGIEDYAVSDPIESNNLLQVGVVRIVSAATKTVLATHWGPMGFERFATNMASGDFDGNGTIDLIVTVGFGPGQRLEIMDPLSGALIATIPVPASVGPTSAMIQFFGHAMDVQDIDGDGMAEILACSRIVGATPPTGVTTIFAGGTGTLTYTTLNPAVSDFARSAEFMDDITGDGVPEVLISAPDSAQGGLSGFGYFGVFDPTAATAIYSSTGSHQTEYLADVCLLVEDLDGDGFRDFVISTSSPAAPSVMSLTTISAQTGASIATIATSISSLRSEFEETVSDVDGDGLRDFVVLTAPAPPAASAYHLSVFSSATLRHLDQFIVPTGPVVQNLKFETVPDINGDGFEELLLNQYESFTTKGPVEIVDLGPALSPLATGNHPLGAELLLVNQETWAPSRRIDLEVNQHYTISFGQDPLTTGPTDFIIFGMIGVPDASTAYPTTIGTFVFPPRVAFVSYPWLFTLADSTGFDQGTIFTPGPAPYTLSAPGGVFFPVQFVLQGVSVSNFGGNIHISNAILIDVF